MRGVVRGRAGMVLAFMLGLLIATAGTAAAAKLITGKQIKDGSIASRDLSKSVRAQIAKAAKPGPQGEPGAPGARGEAGPSTGPAGGDLAGSYPNPTLRAPSVVQVADPPAGVSCILTYDTFCGAVADGNVWADATGGSYGPLQYFVEPGGFVQFQGTVQQVGTPNPINVVFYLPPGRRPGVTLRFPVVTIAGGAVGGHVRIGDNGEVALVGFTPPSADGSKFELSSVRFRIGK